MLSFSRFSTVFKIIFTIPFTCCCENWKPSSSVRITLALDWEGVDNAKLLSGAINKLTFAAATPSTISNPAAKALAVAILNWASLTSLVMVKLVFANTSVQP